MKNSEMDSPPNSASDVNQISRENNEDTHNNVSSPDEDSPVPTLPPSTTHSNNHYHFRWKEHPDSMVSTFLSLKEEEDFVDVTLACQSQQFTAHRVILSACSPYFRKLLKSNPCQHPIVILRDVSENDLQSLLNYMYNGEVQIPEDRLKNFLRTAETLQIRGLTDSESGADATATRTLTKPNSDNNSDQPKAVTNRITLRNNLLEPDLAEARRSNSGSPYFGHSASKRLRLNGPNSLVDQQQQNEISNIRHESSPEQDNSRRWLTSNDNSNSGFFSNNKAKSESILSQALEKTQQQQHQPSMIRSSLGGTDSNHDMQGDEESQGSDTASDQPESLTMDGMIKSSASDIGGDGSHRQSPATSLGGNSLIPPGLEALYRQAGFNPASFFGLGAGSGGGGSPSPSLSMGHNVTNVGLQSHAGNPNLAGKLDMMRVRATDPRPCPKCGKIYRSAHTLRTHMEDKHTICPGYRCVLCGTVAKSRNSLHSHMSRQHRGISTKDLPVVPMPAPFDAALASRLLAKAGVKVSPNELAARASPTAPRRSDLPKLDSNLLHMQHQEFPLQASLPTSLANALQSGNGSDMEDFRSSFGANGGHSRNRGGGGGGVGGFNPKDFGALANNSQIMAAVSAASAAGGGPGGMGSALIDTYLSMIAAAGGDSNAMAAALNFQNSASRAAAFAAVAAASQGGGQDFTGMIGRPNANGDRGGKESDLDEVGMEGELGSDADNDDDLSDNEESRSSRNNKNLDDERENAMAHHKMEAPDMAAGEGATTTAAN